jgi:hypothetical protein
VARRTPRQARALGLWTAGWLFVLLLAGVLWVGELSLQWPVLAVPVVWALIALRPRRRPRGTAGRPGTAVPPAGGGEPTAGPGAPPPGRYPPTRELPWLPDVPPGDRREE